MYEIKPNLALDLNLEYDQPNPTQWSAQFENRLAHDNSLTPSSMFVHLDLDPVQFPHHRHRKKIYKADPSKMRNFIYT